MFTYQSKFQVTQGGQSDQDSLENVIRSALQKCLRIIEGDPKIDRVLDSWADRINNGFVYLVFSNTYYNKETYAFDCRMYIESKDPLDLSDLFTESKNVDLDAYDQLYELSMYDATGKYPVPTLADWQSKINSNSTLVAKYWLHDGDQKGALPYFGLQLHMCQGKSTVQPTQFFT